MKPSLLYRALAKIQTLLIKKLVSLGSDATFANEDVHLKYYTAIQTEAELKLVTSSSALPPVVRLLIVIPFRDKWLMTETCLQGLLWQKREGLEILVALTDNGSVEAETQEGIERITEKFSSAQIAIRHLRYNLPFNFSYLNNQAIKDCADFSADVVALVNNDIEFVDQDNLLQLTKAAYYANVGAAGCTLLYPNRLIQHLFIFVGSKIVGSHPFKGMPQNLRAKWYDRPRVVGAVTGAVMFIQRKNYEAVGGFDEQLPTSYQDVDLCLKFQKMGLVNIVVPRVSMIHHETQTRKLEPSWKEADYVEKKWGLILTNNPFVSPVWSRKSEHFVFTPKAFLSFLFGKNSQSTLQRLP